MEPILDNKKEEEIQHALRAKRIAKMRYEKQLQQKRRQMIRKYLPMGIGTIVIVVLISVTAVLFKKSNENDLQQAQTEGQSELEVESEIQSQDSIQAVLQTDSAFYTNPISNIQTPFYAFEASEDTVTIYSEEIISSNAILIDESTDKIVASKGAKERICPASMTKVLTVLVAAEHITEENLDDTFMMTTIIAQYMTWQLS